MVSPDDKRKMARIAADLAAGETNDRGTESQRAELLKIINADRAAHGRPALTDRAPEEGFYDRARSLGMARIDR